MTKVVMRKRAGCLVADEPEADKLLARIETGARVVVDVRQARDYRQMQKWWRLMEILARNMPVFHADKRAASDMVLIACGEADIRVDPVTQGCTPVPRSIAYEHMEEDAFKDLWTRAKAYIDREWLPIGTAKLEAEIDDFFAGPQARSLGKRVVREREAA